MTTLLPNDIKVDFLEEETLQVDLVDEETFSVEFKSVDYLVPAVNTKNLASLIKENTAYNEVATRVDASTYKTDNNYLSGTLEVFVNGIKEIGITEITSNKFELETPVDNDCQITTNYVKE